MEENSKKGFATRIPTRDWSKKPMMPTIAQFEVPLNIDTSREQFEKVSKVFEKLGDGRIVGQGIIGAGGSEETIGWSVSASYPLDVDIEISGEF